MDVCYIGSYLDVFMLGMMAGIILTLILWAMSNK